MPRLNPFGRVVPAEHRDLKRYLCMKSSNWQCRKFLSAYLSALISSLWQLFEEVVAMTAQIESPKLRLVDQSVQYTEIPFFSSPVFSNNQTLVKWTNCLIVLIFTSREHSWSSASWARVHATCHCSREFRIDSKLKWIRIMCRDSIKLCWSIFFLYRNAIYLCIYIFCKTPLTPFLYVYVYWCLRDNRESPYDIFFLFYAIAKKHCFQRGTLIMKCK